MSNPGGGQTHTSHRAQQSGPQKAKKAAALERKRRGQGRTADDDATPQQQGEAQRKRQREASTGKSTQRKQFASINAVRQAQRNIDQAHRREHVKLVDRAPDLARTSRRRAEREGARGELEKREGSERSRTGRDRSEKSEKSELWLGLPVEPVREHG